MRELLQQFDARAWTGIIAYRENVDEAFEVMRRAGRALRALDRDSFPPRDGVRRQPQAGGDEQAARAVNHVTEPEAQAR